VLGGYSAMDDKENTISRRQQRQKIADHLKDNTTDPSAWLQFINYELELVGGDVEKCTSLGKYFEQARKIISDTKESHKNADYAALCLAHARYLMYAPHPPPLSLFTLLACTKSEVLITQQISASCEYEHCKELLKWVKLYKIGVNSADFFITYAHLESAMGLYF
jgi:hypothetical protein